MNKSCLLLSGGMDSIAIAAWLRPDLAITIDYGQSAAPGEVRAGAAVSSYYGIAHEVLRIDVSALGSGDLVGTKPSSVAPSSEWWPFRNQFLITSAAMRAIRTEIETILIGCVSQDSAHVDGTIEFCKSIDSLLNMQEGRLRLVAPAIDLTSAELVKLSGIEARVLAWSHSCHKSEFACGGCRGCNKHRATMADLGYGVY